MLALVESRERYAIGLSASLLVGGFILLGTHSHWAYLLFALAAVPLIWGFWPLVFGKKSKQDKKQKKQQNRKMVFGWLSTRSKEVKIEVFETKCSYNGDTKCFLVGEEVILKTKVVSQHLAWIRLVIAGKEFDPISSKPPLGDEVKHTQQKYELEYEVDADTFLKGRRYAEPQTMRLYPKYWGFILANVGGIDWKSGEFEIGALPKQTID